MSKADKNIQSDGQFDEDTEQQFREMLLNGEIENALALKKQKNISEQTVNNHTLDVFEVHKEMEQFDIALLIASKFAFPDSEVQKVKVAEWGRLNRKKQFVEAAEWAKSQSLSEVEIHRSGVSAYEKYLEEGNIEEALDIIQKYRLNQDELLGSAIAGFNRIFDKGDFYNAALLGKAFNLSAGRTLPAAVKSCLGALKKRENEKVRNLLEKFKLLSDKIFEELSENDAENLVIELAEEYIQPAFEQGNLQLMHNFAQEIKLSTRPFQNSYLKELLQRFYKIAVNTHNSYLENDDLKSAKFVRDSFDLFIAPIPFKVFATLVKSSEAYHKSLLEGEDLNSAVAFKKDYGIFTKFTVEKSKQTEAEHGALFVVKALEKKQIQPAMSAINEYNVPKELVNDAFLTSILNLAKNKLFDDAFTILDAIKIDLSSETCKARVVNVFKALMKDNDYVNAAEVAHRFRLQKSYESDAANKAWQIEFVSKRYDKALALKNKFKLDKKLTLPLAQKTYRELSATKDYNMAISIRRSYGISIGLVEWILEFIMQIFVK